jgi:hypothetical protein
VGSDPTGPNYQASIQYGISRNSTEADANHAHVRTQYTDVGFTNGAASYQRAGTCTAGQTVTFRFVAHVIDGEKAVGRKVLPRAPVDRWSANLKPDPARKAAKSALREEEFVSGIWSDEPAQRTYGAPAYGRSGSAHGAGRPAPGAC